MGMKKIYSLLIAVLILSINANAQNPTFAWAKSMGSASGDAGYSTLADASGNVYTKECSGIYFVKIGTGIKKIYSQSGGNLQTRS